MADPTAADRFDTAAFGLGTELRLRAAAELTTGFRGFTLSLTASQPANVRALIGAALDAGAFALAKDVGVAPDGTGSHRLVIGSDAGPFTDLDGFAWEAAPPAADERLRAVAAEAEGS